MKIDEKSYVFKRPIIHRTYNDDVGHHRTFLDLIRIHLKGPFQSVCGPNRTGADPKVRNDRINTDRNGPKRTIRSGRVRVRWTGGPAVRNHECRSGTVLMDRTVRNMESGGPEP